MNALLLAHSDDPVQRNVVGETYRAVVGDLSADDRAAALMHQGRLNIGGIDRLCALDLRCVEPVIAFRVKGNRACRRSDIWVLSILTRPLSLSPDGSYFRSRS